MMMTSWKQTGPAGAPALLVLLGALLVVPPPPALAQDPGEGPGGHAGHDHEEGRAEVVRLEAAELREFGVVVATAGPATIRRTLDLPGEIRANDDALAHLVPRFSGIATDVRAQTGDRVAAGQVLAVIESDESLAPYEMRTLMAGTVIDKHITLGEAVSREHAVFVVADLGSVWADITVYQRDLPHVAAGQSVAISGGHGLPQASGRISYVSPVVDETTRAALARVVLPNRDGVWRPGMFVTARIAIDQFEAPVAVPRTALQTHEGRDVVFVQTEAGFVPRPVAVGRSDEERLEIVAGLAVGERYVSQGGFTLKAELGKGSFGGGHAH